MGEKAFNVKEINQLKDSLNVVNQSKNRLDENKKNLENELKIINEQRDEITMELKTEKQVVEGLKCELMKFHQINGEQNESLKEANESNSRFKEEIDAMSKQLTSCNAKIEELTEANVEYAQKEKVCNQRMNRCH